MCPSIEFEKQVNNCAILWELNTHKSELPSLLLCPSHQSLYWSFKVQAKQSLSSIALHRKVLQIPGHADFSLHCKQYLTSSMKAGTVATMPQALRWMLGEIKKMTSQGSQSCEKDRLTNQWKTSLLSEG
jgi:hypothetical protein